MTKFNSGTSLTFTEYICFFYKLGVDEVDYTLYPKREHQLKFIAVYLEEAAKLRGTVCYEAASSLVQFKIILTFNVIQCHFGVIGCGCRKLIFITINPLLSPPPHPPPLFRGRKLISPLALLSLALPSPSLFFTVNK